MSDIIKGILQDGCYPEEFKRSIVILIFKGGDSKLPTIDQLQYKKHYSKY